MPLGRVLSPADAARASWAGAASEAVRTGLKSDRKGATEPHSRWRGSIFGWDIVVTFHIASGYHAGGRDFRRTLQEWGDAFAGWPSDEVSGVIGPRRFAPYGERDSSARGASPTGVGGHS